MVSDQPVSDPTTTGATGAPGATPSDNPAGDASGKSPLDILEEILKQQPAAGAATPPTSEAVPPPEPEPPKMTMEEIEALEVERAAADKVALAAKQAEMATITQTPQYQARESQNQAAAAQKNATEQAMDGFEIQQLGHTKITE